MSRFNILVLLTLLLSFTLPSNAQDTNVAASGLELPPTNEGLPGAGPIRRYDWFQSLWNRKRTQWSQETKRDQGALLFLGDSITQGWGDNLGGNFAGVKVANRGISGDTTRGMLIRLEEDVLAVNPSGVVLLMGTNDLEEGAEPETIAENVSLIIDGLKDYDNEMPIILCKMFPSSSSMKRPADKIKLANELFAKGVMGDPQVTVLDTWTLFANDEGDAKRDEFPDLLHPNQTGYAKWAAALRPILATLGYLDRDVTPIEIEPGYTSLFNGQDLTGWEFRPSSEADKQSSANWRKNDPQAPPWPILTESEDFSGQTASSDGRYIAKNGRLVVTTPPEGRKIQQIWTTQDFNKDFVLKLEFRATPNADSGIFLRGKQLQCRDFSLAGPYKNLQSYRPQDWNEVTIVVHGQSAYCTCNGEVLEETFQIPSKGPIGLEGDRGQIEYRNIRLLEIPSELRHSTPEAQGISSAGILGFVEAADEIDSVHSFMLLRHGHVVAEAWWAPFTADTPHQLYSLSKSFASTAVGLAINEGKLSLDDQVSTFFPDDVPDEPSYNLKAMRIRDLLCMSTGHISSDLNKFSFQSDTRLTKDFLALPVAHGPGTHFLYNTAATYMCSAIVQKVTGEKIVDYLQPRLFAPLGIDPPFWSESPQGISHGGFGLNLKTENIARFGQLYLQKGEWNGRQLVPSSWVAAATSRQTSNGSNPDNDWNQGYGYQFWRCRHNVYRGDGAFGQFCMVMPEQDAVVAITSGTANMGAVMQAVWDHLLPAMQSGRLPNNRAAHRQLEERIATLQIPLANGEKRSDVADKISGKRFRFSENEKGIQSLSLVFDKDVTTLTVADAEGEHSFRCGQGEWLKERVPSMGSLATRVPKPDDVAVAGSGAWSNHDTYTLKLCLFETPYRLDLKVKFADDEVTLDGAYNVGFSETTLPTLVGTRE